MTAHGHLFIWTTQRDEIPTPDLVRQLNQSMRGLNHDLQRQVVFTDHLPRTLTVAHTFAVPVKLTAVTAPATIANVFQVFVDVADGKLKALGSGGTLTPLANP